MPVGKNSIKRVTNNGYSKVASKAPDMENSTVIANPSPEVVEIMIPSSEKIAPKKPAAKKPAAKKTAPKAENSSERNGEGYINLGGELPIYLL
jgi:hypothetical protein